MELAMVSIPLTKIVFHVDNGFSEQLDGTGLSAEYNFFSKSIEWRVWGKTELNRQSSIMKKVLSTLPLSSPFIVLPMIALLGGYTNKIATPIERLSGFAYVIPIILGILLFLGFEYIMLLYMERPKKCAPPKISIQIKYFESIYDFSIKHNNAVGQYKSPYLVNILVSLFTFIVVIPLMFWIYNQSDTTGTFLIKLFVFGGLLSLIPNIFWNMVIKAILIKKILNNLKKEMEK
ncbi:hypothetical protein [Enterococcus sp. AZ050]|uniref:hypothetical protein n=1 Tax=Enterococcus sp. AZ050 TaxID=2774696 RepID=UPI003F68DA2F